VGAATLSKQSDHFVQRPNMIAHACFWWLASRPQRSELPELTRVLVCFDHVATVIVKANHSIM
jgi:hypothetical protein